MSEVKKKAVIITNHENLPIFCVGISELSATEFADLQKLCKKNRAFIADTKREKEKKLLERIDALELEIKKLKGVE